MIMSSRPVRTLRRLVWACLPGLLVLLLGGGATAAEAPVDGPVSYHKQIRPLFQATCQGCHQPAKANGAFVMTDVARMFAPGDSGMAGIVPSKPEESRLLEVITAGPDGVSEMPKQGKPLSAAEVALVRRWISEGAQDDTPPSAAQRVDSEHPPVYSRQPVVTSLDVSPDGRLLAVSGFHEVLLFDVAGAEVPAAPLRRLVGLSERIQRVRFSPDGSHLAVTGGNSGRMGEVQVWNVADGSLVRSHPVTFDTVFGGSWSPDGKLIAFGCTDNTVRAIDVASGEQVLYQGAHEDWALDTVFAPKGDHVISVGRDMSTKLTELATQRFIDNITSITPGALRGGLSALDRHPTLDQIVVAGADGTPRVYRIHRHSTRVIGDDANLIFPLFPLPGRVFGVRFSADGKRVAAVSSLDGHGELVIASYDYDADVPKPVLDVMAKVPGDANRNGSQRSAEEWKTLDDYRATGTREVARVALPEAGAYAVAFQPGAAGQPAAVVVGGADGLIRFFDASSGAPLRSFPVAKIDQAAAARASLPLPWPIEASLEPELPPPSVTGITVEPAAINLDGPFAVSQIVVTGQIAGGGSIDLTRSVRFEGSGEAIPATSLVTVGPGGLVRPLADGTATLRVAHGEPGSPGMVMKEIPVAVAGSKNIPDVDFVRDVNPLLAKMGCNQGTCHGAAKGKNGFKLSLRGYDPIYDVRALTDDHGARRVNLASPDDSLMLLKASAAVPHVGGQLTRPDDPAYQVVRRWIEQGAKLDTATPRVTGITVFPTSAVIETPGRRQQFRVVASFADGRTRDVTREAFLESGNGEVATADRQGLVTALRRGEAPILVRYEGSYAAVTLTVMGDRSGFAWAQPEAWGPIDTLVAGKWEAMKIEPSQMCSDDEFLRRVALDLTGMPPSATEVKRFLADSRDTRIKRAEVVARLVGSEAFVEHWTNKWSDLLQVNPKFLGDEGAKGLRNWIRGKVAANTPYDTFARDVLTATGSNRENPAAAYYKTLRDPLATMENTTHLFLGVRFNCNKCHDHPFERWTQDQYYETAAFFAQVGLDRDPESGDRNIGGSAVEGAKPLYEIVVDRGAGEVTHERTGKPVAPKFPFDCAHAESEGMSRRQQLAAWMTSADNPYFAKSYVNRLWGYLFGAGIIDPIDDIRAGNPATNPALLDHLTKSFIESGFDMRRLLTEICTSRTYGLSVSANRWNDDDKINYSHALPRRLPAETLYDTLHAVVGSPTRFPGYPEGTRAAALPDVSAALGAGFLQTFGKPTRESACECERAGGVALGPVMALVSGPTVGDVLADPGSELSKLVASQADDDRLVNEVFLRILNRPSRPEEVAAVKRAGEEITADHAALSAELAAAEATWKARKDVLEAERQARIDGAKQALVDGTAAHEPRRLELERQRADRLAAALAAIEGYRSNPWAALERTEREAAESAAWQVLVPTAMASRAGATLTAQPDGSILVTGTLADDTTTLTIPLPAGTYTGLRLEVLPDPSLPGAGSGRADDGNFVLTEILGDIAPAARPAEKAPLDFSRAVADFSQATLGVELAIDKNPTNPGQGWAVHPRMQEAHWAVLEFREPRVLPEPAVLTIVLEQRFQGAKWNLGRFRVSATGSKGPLPLGPLARVAEIAGKPRAQRSPEEHAELAAIIDRTDSVGQKLRAELVEAQKPLPADPGLVALAAAIGVAETPVPEESAILRLRADAGASANQIANRRLTTIQDLAWALINSPAFFFNH